MYELEITLPNSKVSQFIKGGSVRLSPSDLTSQSGKKVRMVFKTLKDLNRLKRNFKADKGFQMNENQVDLVDETTGGSLRGLNKVLKAVNTAKNIVDKVESIAEVPRGIMDAYEGGKLSSKQRKLNKNIRKGLEKAFNVVKKEAKKAYIENQDEIKGLAKDLAIDSFKYADGQLDRESFLNNLEHKGKKVGYMAGRQALDRTGIMNREEFNHGQYKKLVPETTMDFSDNTYNPLDEMDPEFNGKGMRRRYGKGLGGTQLINNPMIQGDDMKARMARVRSFRGGSIRPL